MQKQKINLDTNRISHIIMSILLSCQKQFQYLYLFFQNYSKCGAWGAPHLGHQNKKAVGVIATRPLSKDQKTAGPSGNGPTVFGYFSLSKWAHSLQRAAPPPNDLWDCTDVLLFKHNGQQSNETNKKCQGKTWARISLDKWEWLMYHIF